MAPSRKGIRRAALLISAAGLVIVAIGVIDQSTPLTITSALALVAGAVVALIGAILWVSTYVRASPSKTPQWSWAESALVVFIVLLVVALGYSAQQLAQQAASSSRYIPSNCAPVVPAGCVGYSPSNYSPGNATNTGGIFVTGIIIAVAAYYLGKSRGRKEPSVVLPQPPTGTSPPQGAT